MDSIHQEHDKTSGEYAVEEERIESLLKKLKPNESAATIKENEIEKCEIQLEECSADIDDIFMKLYGQPGQPISAEEQREIINKENARRKRAESLVENRAEDGETDENGSSVSEMVLIEEDIIEHNSVTFEQAEVDWDDLFEDLESSENGKVRNAPWKCTIV